MESKRQKLDTSWQSKKDVLLFNAFWYHVNRYCSYEGEFVVVGEKSNEAILVTLLSNEAQALGIDNAQIIIGPLVHAFTTYEGIDPNSTEEEMEPWLDRDAFVRLLASSVLRTPAKQQRV